MATTGPRIECHDCGHDHSCKTQFGWIVLSIAACDEPGCHCPGNPRGQHDTSQV